VVAKKVIDNEIDVLIDARNNGRRGMHIQLALAQKSNKELAGSNRAANLGG
jgi:hypothetical protein